MWDEVFPNITTAFDLIERIAIEPVVARYIIYANFDRDAFPYRIRMRRDVPDVHLSGPVVKLFADSLYLRQASLDWREYYAQIKQDRPRYSQHAAAFLLTLLPNVKTLKMPHLWEPVDKTEELFEVVCRQANRSHYPLKTPSLAQVTTFQSFSGRRNLEKAVPFLALPNLRTFAGRNSISIGFPTAVLASKYPYFHFSETLESVGLLGCCIDEVAIINLLKHTPRLRMFKYSHSTRETDDNRDWDICKFVTAIERVAGSYLEGLSVTVGELSGSVIPGRVSISGFQRLRQLQLPLCIAPCNTIDAVSQVATLNENPRDRE